MHIGNVHQCVNVLDPDKRVRLKQLTLPDDTDIFERLEAKSLRKLFYKSLERVFFFDFFLLFSQNGRTFGPLFARLVSVVKQHEANLRQLDAVFAGLKQVLLHQVKILHLLYLE